MRAGLAGRSKLWLADRCVQAEGQGDWSHRRWTQAIDTALGDASLESPATLGAWVEEPWPTVISGLQKVHGAVSEERSSNGASKYSVNPLTSPCT